MASRADERGPRRGDADLRRVRGRGEARRGGLTLNAESELNVVLCGADADGLRWARRCALRSGVVVAGSMDASERRGLAERAEAFADIRPDVLLLVGRERHAHVLAEVVEAARAYSAGSPSPIDVVCAADPGVHARVHAAAAGFLSVTRAVHPRRDSAQAVEQLRALRRRDGPLALESLEARARAIGAPDAVACEVDSRSTRIAFGTKEGVVALELAGVGLGPKGDALIRRVGAASVRRWLLAGIDLSTLRDRVANGARWPAFERSHAIAFAIELALAREALRLAAEAARQHFDALALVRPGVVVVSGPLAAREPPSAALAVVLDGLQPRGAFPVRRDDRPLALVLAHPSAKRPIAIRVADPDGARTHSVPPGSILAFAAQARARAAAERERLSVEGDAGPAGVVVDARSRPLVLPERDAERLPLVAAWTAALGLLQ